MPAASAIIAAVQCVASAGAASSPRATTRRAMSAARRAARRPLVAQQALAGMALSYGSGASPREPQRFSRHKADALRFLLRQVAD